MRAVRCATNSCGAWLKVDRTFGAEALCDSFRSTVFVATATFEIRLLIYRWLLRNLRSVSKVKTNARCLSLMLALCLRGPPMKAESPTVTRAPRKWSLIALRIVLGWIAISSGWRALAAYNEGRLDSLCFHAACTLAMVSMLIESPGQILPRRNETLGSYYNGIREGRIPRMSRTQSLLSLAVLILFVTAAVV